MATRNGSAEWRGDLKGGAGTVKVGDGVFEGIAKIDLDVEGSVPGIDEGAFRSYAEKAKDGCVVSRALAGVPEIILDARLA